MIYLARDILNMSAEDIHNQPDEVVEIGSRLFSKSNGLPAVRYPNRE